MIIAFIHYLILVICVLISVSFYTLYERKMLGAIHIRKGPQLLGWWGIIQPFADAVKLFTKGKVMLKRDNRLVYLYRPVVLLLCSLLVWVVVPVKGTLLNGKFIVLTILLCGAGSVYGHLCAGWRRNSNYAIIGSLRCVAQSLSYEVRLSFIFIIIIISATNIQLEYFYRMQEYCPSLVWLFSGFILWSITVFAETNRRPFDFAEGERELVSGFNVEYGGGLFAIMFIAEYASMIFIRAVTTLVFVGVAGVGFAITTGLFIVFIVWVRGSYPRTRYDKLMSLCWLIILPISLGLLLFMSML